MSEEKIREIREIINQHFIESIMTNLDSSMIFTYISNLEKENIQLKERIDKAIEWIYIVQQDKDNKYLEPIINTDELDEQII